LSPGRSPLNRDRRAELLALAGELRPDLHRYCARFVGSVIDGEDVLQDTLIRAFVASQDLDEAPALRPWLFQIAHNRALDLVQPRGARGRTDRRSRRHRRLGPARPLGDVDAQGRGQNGGGFVELPTLQRSVLILKDVLDESLIEIARPHRPYG
jgi:DNA-directed RNA polymerase specialized sigma24 family protein